MEFANNERQFDLNQYESGHAFTVMGQITRSDNWRTPSVSLPVPASTSGASNSANTPSSQKKRLAQVTVVRAEIGANGKPFNSHKHNKTAVISIYNEEDANVDYLLQKTLHEMKEENLVLVRNSGLKFTDQEGTR